MFTICMLQDQNQKGLCYQCKNYKCLTLVLSIWSLKSLWEVHLENDWFYQWIASFNYQILDLWMSNFQNNFLTLSYWHFYSKEVDCSTIIWSSPNNNDNIYNLFTYWGGDLYYVTLNWKIKEMCIVSKSRDHCFAWLTTKKSVVICKFNAPSAKTLLSNLLLYAPAPFLG